MRIILSKNLVSYAEISKDIDAMLQAVDVLGPAALTDSSMEFWRLILDKRSTVVHSTNFVPGERLFPWFASKWKPGMFNQ